MKIRTIRAYLILPMCLLFLNAIEEIAVYKLQTLNVTKIQLTAILVLMFALGFTVVGDFIAPKAQKILEKGHKTSKKSAGLIGTTIFYGIILAFVFFIYYMIYTEGNGPGTLLPKSWRN